MAEQENTPDAPAHTPGTSGGHTARDSTGINPEERGPVDPKMPDMPPA